MTLTKSIDQTKQKKNGGKRGKQFERIENQ